VLHVGWELDEEHEQFRGTCRAFTDREVRPLVEQAEANGRFPGELWKPLGAAGLLGLVTPEEHGGARGDSRSSWTPPAGLLRRRFLHPEDR
jgi:acyl-CoA dehydrogenase